MPYIIAALVIIKKQEDSYESYGRIVQLTEKNIYKSPTTVVISVEEDVFCKKKWKIKLNLMF